MTAESERQQLISQLRAIAKELNTETVPRHEFLRRARVSERKVLLLFGSYNEFIQAAGLQPTIFPSSEAPKYSDQELLLEMVRVFRLPESKLTRIYFDQNSIGGKSSAIERRFGGWINAVRLVLQQTDPVLDRDLIEKMKSYASPQVDTTESPNGVSEAAKGVVVSGSTDMIENQTGHEPIEGSANLYGDFINFRGLQHAPVNEQGVVFLFGMTCRELGYVVEIVRSGFPDCEAKRRLKGKSGMWQRVRIEFEFQSRSFRSHGHDPDQCDLIVCWQDNWPECPIEVLELQSVLKKIPPEGS